MSKIFTAAVGAAALSVASVAAATTTIDFTNPAGNVGSATHTYSDGAGLSVVATAYGPHGGNLYGKNAGGDEVGLGIASSGCSNGTCTIGDPAGQNEIYQNAFIQLDVSNLIGKVSSATFKFGSDTLGETWAIFGSNSAGSYSGFALLTGTNDETTHNLTALAGWGSYKYYDFVSLGTKTAAGGYNAGNVLLGNFTLTRAVPEPATWVMMLLGFGAIGLSARRRRSNERASMA